VSAQYRRSPLADIRHRRTVFFSASLIALSLRPTTAAAQDSKLSQSQSPPPALRVATAPSQPSEAPRTLLVATSPTDIDQPDEPPARAADGAGPRLTFGRAYTDAIASGFYGRFETEYFDVRKGTIVGILAGLEGWGSKDGGGGAVPITLFAGLRGGPFRSPKAPVFFATIGAGVDLAVFDRLLEKNGFGLLSPVAVAAAGVELTPGLRTLIDARAVYRWHWTDVSRAQVQLGLTLSANSYLWDGPG
jgi:hypothetical protein